MHLGGKKFVQITLTQFFRLGNFCVFCVLSRTYGCGLRSGKPRQAGGRVITIVTVAPSNPIRTGVVDLQIFFMLCSYVHRTGMKARKAHSYNINRHYVCFSLSVNREAVFLLSGLFLLQFSCRFHASYLR